MSFCNEYEEALVDHAFSAPAADALEVHLVACEACRARLEKERGLAAVVDGELSSALDVSPRAGFDNAVRRRIASRTTRARWRRWSAAAAGLAAVTAGIVLLRGGTAQQTAPPVVRKPVSEAAAVPIASATPAVPPLTIRRAAGRPASKTHEKPEELVDLRQTTWRRVAETAQASSPAPVSELVLIESPLPLRPLEIGTIDDLPRLSVQDDLPAFEPPRPLERLATGGDV